MWKNILTYAILPICIAALIYVLITSIAEPDRFAKQEKYRRDLTVERLKDIRTLQVAFRQEYGRYTASFDTLIDFYKNGQMRVVRQIGSMDDSLAVAQGLVRRDTIRIAVKDTLLRRPGFSVDSLRIVPVVNQPFEMRATIKKVSGVDVPLFEACTPYNVVLAGLDRQLIINLMDEKEKVRRYPGLKVGSIDQPNNNAGNWE